MRHRPIRVLLIDNDRDIKPLADEILRSSEGMDIVTATSTEEAWHGIRSDLFDVIVCYCHTPANDVIDLLNRMRAANDLTPFIVLTTSAGEELVIKALNSGADSFIRRDGDLRLQCSELQHTIRRTVERRRYREEREADAFQDRLIAANLVPLMALDAKGAVTNVNAAASEMVGISREKMIGTDFFRLCSEPSKAREQYLNDLEEGNIRDHHIALAHRSGHHVEVAYGAVVHHDRDGEASGVLATIRDITERKVVEDTHREDDANLRTFFDSMTDLVVVGTHDGHILFSNAAASRNLGYSPEELKDMKVTDLHPASRRKEAESIFAAMFRGECDCCPIPLERKDGTLLPVETRTWSQRWNGIECIIGICRDRTAEEESKQRFEKLFRSNPAPMVLSTLPERRLLDVNDAFIETVGYSREDVIGRTAMELGLFADQADHAIVSSELLKQGRIANLEVRVLRKDGTIIEGLLSGEEISSHGQKRFLSVMIDITDRKRTEAALRGVAYARSLIEASLDPLVTIDTRGRITDVNAATSKLTGLPREKIIGTDFSRYFTDPRKAEAGYLKAFQEGHVQDYSLTLINPSGDLVEVMYNASVYRDAKGDVAGVFAAARDVTERRRAEMLLEKSEERFKLSMDATNDGLYDWNLMTDEVFFSPGCPRMLGYEPAEFMRKGVAWVDMIHPEDQARALQARAERTASRGGAVDIEYRIRSKDGMWRQVLDRGKCVVSDVNGNALRMVGTITDMTERKRVENELRSSQRLLSRILDTSPNLIYIYDLKEHRNIYSNREVVQFLGYNAKQVQDMGSRLFELILHPDDAKKVEEYQERLRHSVDGEIMEAEYRMRREDGRWCWLRSRDVTFDRDPDGSVRNELGIAEDVTERKKAELTLQENEERLREIIEDTQAGYFYIDRAGLYQHVNPAWLHMHKYNSADEVVGRHFSITQPEKDWENARKTVEQLLTGASISSGESPRLCHDGSVGYHNYSIHPVRHEGEVVGLEGFIIDTTESKRAVEALRRSKERMDITVESSGVGLWDWMVQTGETTFNERWANIVGYTLEELWPASIDTWNRLTHPDDRRRSNDLLVKHFSGATETYECEVRMKHKDGRWIWALDRGRVSAWDPQGRPTRMCGTHMDITERKRAEDAVLMANRKLNLLSSITRHDINNKLMIVSGDVELIEEGAHDPDLEPLFKAVKRAIEKIHSLIQFTNTYENIGVLAPTWQDIHVGVKTAWSGMEVEGISIVNDIPIGTLVFADPLIQKVFLNLMDNAIRHGGKLTKIRFSLQDGDDHAAIICEDDGQGVPVEEKQRIFERGYGHHTGLGLFLSREILAITDITIMEDGSAGEGARFVLTIPKGGFKQGELN